ncbi:MAG: radical SAM protein, partial [Acidimicrobiia bacterium]
MVFKALETAGLEAGSLRAVEIGVTSRCNFRCSYCGAYDLREKQILSVEQLVATLERLPDLKRVKLSGGEVLLEFDICEGIVRWCSERGIDTQINSNGTLLDEERFRRMEHA